MKRPIIRITSGGGQAQLSLSSKLLPTLAATAALALPLPVGLMKASQTAAQSAGNTPLPAFEVAAVKLDRSGDFSSRWHDDSSRTILTNVPLRAIIERAYGVKNYQIAGPDWLKSQRFDIQAEAPASIPKEQLKEQRPLMLQSLLIDRFKLALHREQRVLPVYALVIAKNGPKLSPVQNDGHSSFTSNRAHLSVERGSLPQIAEALSAKLDRPVIDKTGLTGTFKCELNWTPDDNPTASADQRADTTGSDDSAPSLFTAVQEQLGLKLVPQKGPVEFLVIDHIERIPTEN